MSKNEVGIPLSKVLSLPDGKTLNRIYLAIMLEENLPILCVNRSEHTQKLTPFKPLYDQHYFRQKGDEEFYVTGYGLERLKELAIAKTGSWNFTEAEEEIIVEEKTKIDTETETKTDAKTDKEPDAIQEEESGFGSDYDNIAQLSAEEKVQLLSRKKIQLDKLLIQKSRDPVIIAEVLASTISDTLMINHSVLDEIINFADEQAKAFSKKIISYTSEIVKSTTKLLLENVFSDSLMRTITEKSKGIVFRHITRVYLNGIAFLAYINKIITSSSALIKIRADFSLKYRKFYQALLPHIDSYHITLDQIFMGGLREIPSEIFIKWSVGFFVHDIGKAADIQYHESDAAYDRVKVVDHVKVGYSSITEKTNYPREVGLIVGYHHEYYGDPDGYGPYRDDLAEYKSQVADVKQDYCITYDLESILDFKALAYFPAKVLEIIDVYDSLTDPRRVYRKPLSSEEALDMMYKEFITKRRKLDPILFDIFLNFIHEKEAKNNAELNRERVWE